VTEAYGREVTRAEAKGYIKVKFQVAQKDMDKFGFDTEKKK